MARVSSERQIRIGEILFLIAGVGAGLAQAKVVLIDIGGYSAKDFSRSWSLWFCLAYACVLGAAMTTSVLLVVDRIRTGYRWKTGALAWFWMGCLAWLSAAFLATDHLFSLFFSEAPVFKGRILSELGIESLGAGLHFGGVILFVACLASGRTVRQWWRGRGWWPEWTGVWLLIVMSIGGFALWLLEA